jgi:hypothetical protein
MRYEFGNGEGWELTVDPRTFLSVDHADRVTRVSWAGECRRVGERRKIVGGNASHQTATPARPSAVHLGRRRGRPGSVRASSSIGSRRASGFAVLFDLLSVLLEVELR